MKYKINLHPIVVKYLNSLRESERSIIKSKLMLLKERPKQKRAKVDIKKLGGKRKTPLYRLRVGDYRVIYAVVENEVRVIEIMPRGKDYRNY